MKTQETEYGTLFIGDQLSIFKGITSAIETAAQCENPTIGLTGGSTPKAYYDWVAENDSLSADVQSKVSWYTSDERCVALDDDESNFGNADRKMLKALNIDASLKKPWPVDLEPSEAALKFDKDWSDTVGADKAFGLCLLGMGDDCHTASIFPGSPLIDSNPSENFAFVEVPGKGPRLTITPEGLKRCRKIVITVCGAGKVEALKQIFKEDHNPKDKPVQLLKDMADKVSWLIDDAAAAGL